LRTKWFIIAAVAVLLLFAFTWQQLMFATTVIPSESRPTLLRDAEWGTPVLSFSRRFGNGTPETELLRWLADNRFEEVDKNSASRTVHGLPCNERVEIAWTTLDGKIRESSAVVSEAGCL